MAGERAGDPIEARRSGRAAAASPPPAAACQCGVAAALRAGLLPRGRTASDREALRVAAAPGRRSETPGGSGVRGPTTGDAVAPRDREGDASCAGSEARRGRWTERAPVLGSAASPLEAGIDVALAWASPDAVARAASASAVACRGETGGTRSAPDCAGANRGSLQAWTRFSEGKPAADTVPVFSETFLKGKTIGMREELTCPNPL